MPKCLLCGHKEAQHDWIKDHKFIPSTGIQRVFSLAESEQEESFTVSGFVSPLGKPTLQDEKQLFLAFPKEP